MSSMSNAWGAFLLGEVGEVERKEEVGGGIEELVRSEAERIVVVPPVVVLAEPVLSPFVPPPPELRLFRLEGPAILIAAVPLDSCSTPPAPTPPPSPVNGLSPSALVPATSLLSGVEVLLLDDFDFDFAAFDDEFPIT